MATVSAMMDSVIQNLLKMKSDIKKEYTNFHQKKQSQHLYPTEWVIRTMLGSYPELKMNRSCYQGGKILDLGFGDGRNMQLLHNCGLQIHGVEISDETCELVGNRMMESGIEVDLRTGSNSQIPFPDNYFDYVLASSSCYYVDRPDTFDDNMKEIARVLKQGGTLIANFPLFSPNSAVVNESFILQDAETSADGHIIIKNDIYGIRNGYTFKAFYSTQDLTNSLSAYFNDFSFGRCLDCYFGVSINSIFTTCRKIQVMRF